MHSAFVLLLLALSGLTFLVCIHELGHFGMARLFKMAVSRFSLGFGPILLRKRFGETDYMLRAIPAGGSVQILGEPGSGGAGYRETVEELKRGRSGAELRTLLRRDRRIRYKSPLQQFLLAFAGPVASLALGITLLAFLNMTVGTMREVQGRSVQVMAVVPGSPAEQGGVQAGDRIVTVNGVAVGTYEALRRETVLSGETPTQLEVERGLATLTVTVTPKLVKDELFRIEQPQLGVQVKPGEFVMDRAGLWEGFQLAAVDAAGILKAQGRAIVRLFTGQVPIKSLSGPVGIVHTVGVHSMFGVAPFIYILAVISISIGAFNLLPLLPLDGGRMLFSALQGVFRRPVPFRIQLSASVAGFLLLAVVGVIGLVNDITRISS
jgi:regulator of sigma E protease